MVRIRSIFIFIICALSLTAEAQDYNYAFLVEFTDKNNSIYSVENPLEYLSERAIERRKKENIEITEQDFPVNGWYVDSVLSYDAEFHVSSRWFNSAVFTTNSSSFLTKVNQLSFVKKVSLVYQKMSKKSVNKSKLILDGETLNYGDARNQIYMCNAHELHNKGYKGEGIHIAVMDAGFYNADILSCFDSLWIKNQILDYRDFVERGGDLFNSHTHGTKVLSTIASNAPGVIMGTAPNAYYYLYRTEDGASEFPIEEENWIAAAEVADSAGVDIITTSLGYSNYDLPELSYVYSDMDGNTARITRGAEVAFSKGILLVNSAGNEGNDPWKYITAPSDGENVLCVGAVGPDKRIAEFSSRGPAADGRQKPDIVAQGAYAAVISTDNTVVFRNGTSFSCPIMAGMLACFWQALPECSNAEIMKLVNSYGNKYNNPDNIYGNGLPDFGKLNFTLDTIDFKKPNSNKIVKTYPNPFINKLKVHFYIKKAQKVDVKITNLQGKTIFAEAYEFDSEGLHYIELPFVKKLPNGLYSLSMLTNEGVITRKILKL